MTAPTPGHKYTITCLCCGESQLPERCAAEGELRGSVRSPAAPFERQLRYRSPPRARHPPGPCPRCRPAAARSPRSRGGRRAPKRKQRGGKDAPRCPGPRARYGPRQPGCPAAPPARRASGHCQQPPHPVSHARLSFPLPSLPPAGATHHITPRSGRDGAMRGRKGRERFPSPRQRAGPAGHVAEAAPAGSRVRARPDPTGCPDKPALVSLLPRRRQGEVAAGLGT